MAASISIIMQNNTQRCSLCTPEQSLLLWGVWYQLAASAGVGSTNTLTSQGTLARLLSATHLSK